MIVWRISNYADLRGIGGLRAPGRWHGAGRAVVYLAEHPALALLELLVHLEITSVDDLPDTYQLLKVEVPDEVTLSVLDENALPGDWRINERYTQSAGNEWLGAATTILLRVPSAILPSAHNFLFNPVHSDAAGCRIVDASSVQFDHRLFKLLPARHR
jgi:RES domain-containing protein